MPVQWHFEILYVDPQIDPRRSAYFERPLD